MLPHLRQQRRRSAIEPDGEDAVLLRRGADDVVELRLAQSKGFLAVHVLARPKGLRGEPCVGRMTGCDDYPIHVGIVDDLVGALCDSRETG